MAEKVTVMVLKVDLQCPRCYKKVKKILCQFHQIRDQTYDMKQNTVTISVVCCNPEKIRDKLCCKGGKTIKSIEIVVPPKPKLPEKPKVPEKPKEPEKPKVPEKPKEPTKPKEPEKPKEKPKEEPKEPAKLKEPEKPPALVVVSGYPPFYPGGAYHEGRAGGPCYEGYGRPVPSYDNYGYGPYGYGGNRACNPSQCDYFSEENPSGCTIM